MSRLLTDVTDLAGYDEPVTAPKYLDTLDIAREYAGQFPTVALERGASSFVTALCHLDKYAVTDIQTKNEEKY